MFFQTGLTRGRYAEVRRALAAEGLGPPGSGLDTDVVVPMLSVGLPGVPSAAILRVAKCGIL